jgi:hypothetical protein
MTFLFFSKKNLLRDSSSAEIGVSSSLKIHPSSGFPFVNCKGVTIAIRLSICLDVCFRVNSVTGSFGTSESESPNPCEGIFAWPWAFLPGVPFLGFPPCFWGTLAPSSEVPTSLVFHWSFSPLGLESFAPLAPLYFVTRSYGDSPYKIWGRQLCQCSLNFKNSGMSQGGKA